MTAVSTNVLHNKFISLLVSSLFVSLFMTAVFFTFPVRYESNDDFAIVSELNGFLPGTDCYFLNPITSKILYCLYQTYPATPWYGIWIYFVIFCSYTLYLSVFLRANSLILPILISPCILVIFFHCFAFASFTSASILLLFSVVICFLDWALTDQHLVSHPGAYSSVLSAGLLISFSLRWQLVFYSTFMIAAILPYFNKSFLKKTWPLSASLAVIVLASIIYIVAEKTSTDGFFSRFNQARGKFHDSAHGEYYGKTTIQAIKKAGWSLNDFIIFRNYWFLFDQETFTVNRVNTFTKENDPIQRLPILKQIQHRILIHFQGNRMISEILVLTIFLLFFYHAKLLHNLSTSAIIRMTISLMIVIAGTLYLLYYRFVPRVYLPLYGYILGVTFLLLRHHAKMEGFVQSSSVQKTTSKIIYALLFLLLCTLVWSKSKSLVDHMFIREKEKKTLQSQLAEVEKKEAPLGSPLLIPIDPNNNLLQETINPLKEFSDFTKAKLVPVGWQINSPRYFRLLNSLGLNNGREFLHWTINNSRALWFQYIDDIKNTNITNYIEDYFQEHIHTGKKVRFKVVYDFRNEQRRGLVMYRLVTDEIQNTSEQ